MGNDAFDRIYGSNYGELWSGDASCRVENEWTLPDYKEAAQRLLRLDADPCITSKTLYVKGQEMICEVEGEVNVLALYQPEGEGGEENVCSFNARGNFFHSFHAPLPEGKQLDPDMTLILCEGESVNVNARLLGPRRLSCRCDVALTLSLRGNREIPCYSNAVPEDVEAQTEERETTILKGVLKQEMELRELLTLPASYPPIREMTDLHFSLFAEKVRVSDGNVDFTGHLSVNAAYAPEGENGVISFCQPLEFDKSIGTALASAGDLCEVTLKPLSIHSSVEMSEGGENKDLALEIQYTAELCLFRRDKIRYVTDLFSLTHEMEIRSSEEKLRVHTAVRDFRQEVHAEAPLKHAPFVRAENVHATLRFLDSVREGRKIIVRGEVNLKYLTFQENGSVADAEDSMELRFDLPDQPELPEGESGVELWGGVSDAQITLRDDVIDVKLELFGRVGLYREDLIRPVTEIRRGEELPPLESGILFYYPDADETLWDVCRKCRAGLDRVRAENNCEGDGVPELLRILYS